MAKKAKNIDPTISEIRTVLQSDAPEAKIKSRDHPR